jgi:type I restriction enzyme S subunit
MKNFTVFPGDIIVSCAGTIGEIYIMPKNIELGIINQALMKMSITKEIDINYFLLYFDIIIKKNSQKYSKGSAIKNIPPFEIFKKILLPLPPIQEQKRIVEKVKQIFSYLQ